MSQTPKPCLGQTAFMTGSASLSESGLASHQTEILEGVLHYLSSPRTELFFPQPSQPLPTAKQKHDTRIKVRILRTFFAFNPTKKDPLLETQKNLKIYQKTLRLPQVARQTLPHDLSFYSRHLSLNEHSFGFIFNRRLSKSVQEIIYCLGHL